MNHSHNDDHGPAALLARSEVGTVSVCACGVITVTLQYLSLRFEAGAFRDLQGLLNSAQHRLDGDEHGQQAKATSPGTDMPSVH